MNELQTKLAYSYFTEEEELDLISYKLRETRGYYPERKLKGYNLILDIKQGKHSAFEVYIDDIEYLAEIIEFLLDIKTEWKNKLGELQNASTKL